mmetsp:Transcript_99330/g.171101  ORF Transcript_99330/g.171101 Transcript_99330/m.171101 type:complete len:141 (-) Transcript_99330:3-425(-)
MSSSMPVGWTLPRPATPNHGGNAQVPPECWAMTLRQLQDFIQACKETQKWQELKNEEVWRDGELVKPAGYVNGYQFCDHFVKPWTSGTGSSVALLMNPTPLRAQLMLSHSWAEDVEEVLEALLSLGDDDSMHTKHIWSLE